MLGRQCLTTPCTNSDELKTVAKISRAKSVEVHKLQSEYMQSNTKSLDKLGILLNNSHTGEMRTLKDMMKTKDGELQRLLLEQKKGEGEFVIDRVCVWPKLTSPVL